MTLVQRMMFMKATIIGISILLFIVIRGEARVKHWNKLTQAIVCL